MWRWSSVMRVSPATAVGMPGVFCTRPVVQTPPRGCAAAANVGMRNARGEVVASVDDDDVPVGKHDRQRRFPQRITHETDR